MSANTRRSLQPAPDRMVKVAAMIVRFGFLGALILGIGMLGELWTPQQVRDIHMGFGILVLVGIWLAALRLTIVGRGGLGWPVWVAALLALVGAGFGMGMLNPVLGIERGIIHLIVMLLTVAFAEMGIGRANRKA